MYSQTAALAKATAAADAAADALQRMYDNGAGVSVELANAVEDVRYTIARLRDAEAAVARRSGCSSL